MLKNKPIIHSGDIYLARYIAPGFQESKLIDFFEQQDCVESLRYIAYTLDNDIPQYTTIKNVNLKKNLII